jgi:hypothetical protein
VLGHRLILTPDAMLRDETVEGVIERIVTRVKPPLGVASRGAPSTVETAARTQPRPRRRAARKGTVLSADDADAAVRAVS